MSCEDETEWTGNCRWGNVCLICNHVCFSTWLAVGRRLGSTCSICRTKSCNTNLPTLTHKRAQSIWIEIGLSEIQRIFPIKLHNFKLWKKSKWLIFRFPEGCYFWNCDSTEVKRSSPLKWTFLLWCERHRWHCGSGLKKSKNVVYLCEGGHISPTSGL